MHEVGLEVIAEPERWQEGAVSGLQGCGQEDVVRVPRGVTPAQAPLFARFEPVKCRS